MSGEIHKISNLMTGIAFQLKVILNPSLTIISPCLRVDNNAVSIVCRLIIIFCVINRQKTFILVPEELIRWKIALQYVNSKTNLTVKEMNDVKKTGNINKIALSTYWFISRYKLYLFAVDFYCIRFISSNINITMDFVSRNLYRSVHILMTNHRNLFELNRILSSNDKMCFCKIEGFMPLIFFLYMEFLSFFQIIEFR